MLALALATLLTASPLTDGDAESPPPVGEEEPAWDDELEEPPRLDLKIWGGQAWGDAGNGGQAAAYGAEATWRFDPIDLGVFGGCYEGAAVASDARCAPIYLIRLGQRFETRNGLLASLTLGAGGVKTSGWQSWFQVAVGARAGFGPAFVAGELSFESESLVRLSLGLGVSLL